MKLKTILTRVGIALGLFLFLGILLGFVARGLGVFDYRKPRNDPGRVQIGELVKAVEMFYTDCRRYPTSDEGLRALVQAPEDCKKWGPNPYVREQLLKDPWNQSFTYVANDLEFEIKTYGADQRPGGDGVNRDISSKD